MCIYYTSYLDGQQCLQIIIYNDQVGITAVFSLSSDLSPYSCNMIFYLPEDGIFVLQETTTVNAFASA